MAKKTGLLIYETATKANTQHFLGHDMVLRLHHHAERKALCHHKPLPIEREKAKQEDKSNERK
jgi:hypothetical protein